MNEERTVTEGVMRKRGQSDKGEGEIHSLKNEIEFQYVEVGKK